MLRDRLIDKYEFEDFNESNLAITFKFGSDLVILRNIYGETNDKRSISISINYISPLGLRIFMREMQKY